MEGSVENALSTKGVRCRLYRHADSGIGYYDPDHPNAFWYDGTTLMVHVLFTLGMCHLMVVYILIDNHSPEHDALVFDSNIRLEESTPGSALNDLSISTKVAPNESSGLRRIYFSDYIPTGFESPQNTASQIASSVVTLCIQTTDEFEYQRIEACSALGRLERRRVLI